MSSELSFIPSADGKYGTKNKFINMWRNIKGYEGFYKISSTGRVMSIDRKIRYKNRTRKIKSRLINDRINNRGYKVVRLSRDGVTSTKFIHILSAEAYVSNPLKRAFVNHIDGNKLNNHYTNLNWVTHSENIQHAYKAGLIKVKSKAVLDESTGTVYQSIKEAAKAINIGYGTCRNYLNGNIKCNKTTLRFAA